MTAKGQLPAIVNLEREEWLHDDSDEPDFPEPYRSLYRDYVAKMEEDTSVLPGMGTVVAILIRLLARDYIANLMVDRRDSLHGEIMCRTCNATQFVPFWPVKDARLIHSAREILKQASRADLEHAMRTEFVLGLVAEVARVIEAVVEDQADRLLLKEQIRGAFRLYLERSNEGTKIGSRR